MRIYVEPVSFTTLAKAVAAELQQVRRAQGVSQQELADLAGTRPVTSSSPMNTCTEGAAGVYLPALEKARAEGRTLTEVVTDALLDYVGDDEED